MRWTMRWGFGAPRHCDGLVGARRATRGQPRETGARVTACLWQTLKGLTLALVLNEKSQTAEAFQVSLEASS